MPAERRVSAYCPNPMERTHSIALEGKPEADRGSTPLMEPGPLPFAAAAEVEGAETSAESVPRLQCEEGMEQ